MHLKKIMPLKWHILFKHFHKCQLYRCHVMDVIFTDATMPTALPVMSASPPGRIPWTRHRHICNTDCLVRRPQVCSDVMRNVLDLTWLLLMVITSCATGHSPPGKPTLTSCRSPEKETFTCWWQPGSDGGQPTTYKLYYRKEGSDFVQECPDYLTAGENSCFFNKNDTSIWVNYNITVVATNRLGSTFSDPVDVDVVYIVQPNPPENVSLSIMEDKGWPFLRVAWEPPRKADTRSGWITLIYELRIQTEGETDWETHTAGQQKLFNIFSLRSGGWYLVQVRCKPDHGFWSEWSAASHIHFPEYFPREKSAWIIIPAVCTFIFLVVMWLLYMNSRSLKHCLLPPVPGPKIKGFDRQLLKKGKSENIFSALVVSDFPAMSSLSEGEDLLVEYLEVYNPEGHEAALEGVKDLDLSTGFKLESSACDSDSGRGSCDSHTLLIEKCGRPKEDEDGTGERPEREDTGSRMWPSAFSSPLDRPRRCLSDSLSWVLGPSEGQVCQEIKARSDVNIAASGHKQSPARWSIKYVGVQTVGDDNVVILQPWSGGVGCSPPVTFQGQDYSRVKRIGNDDTLLFLQSVSEGSAVGCEGGSSFGDPSQKGAACMHSTTAMSGYVDSAALFPLKTH
ncbi:prolactin receptor a isoform X2 [Syngnathoides biaculeatus]|uniref:prolactin receptor a isoform X2 n=2 Tax=Syngnathoides biaculeatus TaxID=300417 RepID=UPI002ADE1D0C|nr:prolactin receptor a isoform X2 [Syngnathoides biaculeatus]